MNENKAKLLLQKYLLGNCTEEEKALLESWYLQQNLDLEHDINEAERENDLQEVFARLESEYTAPQRVVFLWPKIAVAASLLFAITIGLYFYVTNPKDNNAQNIANIQPKSQIQPGGNKAILILADGKKISLEDAKVGELAIQPGIKITKTADGQIIYTISNANKNNNSYGFNTIETPRGGQFQVNLPDGTKVWLNAASSLKYPVSFSEKERRIELSGEAYFEVTHNPSKPFKVVSNNQVVEVLGTHFNVNTYLDEPAANTTLLEGSVKVSSLSGNNTSGIILKPGEQAVHTADRIAKTQIDTEQVIAWKNGFFQFENASLETVMRQIARWYDLEVEYSGKIPNRVFNGKVYRNMSLSKALSVLSFSKINYKVEGKRLIIMP